MSRWDEIVKCRECRAEKTAGSVNGYGECGDCCQRRIERQKAEVAAHPEVDVMPGDLVAIHHRTGRHYGRVAWAVNWRGELGWHVGFLHLPGSAGQVGDQGVWKQGSDGGRIEVLPPPSA